MQYGKILSEIRKEYNLTQEKMANIIGISRGLYSQYEIGEKVIPIMQLNKISICFKYSFDYLFGLCSEKKYDNMLDIIDKGLVGDRLKKFRKVHKLTQDKIAQNLNTTHSTLSAYEHGKTLILTQFLFDICKKYNISADYLLGKIDYIPDWCNKNFKNE